MAQGEYSFLPLERVIYGAGSLGRLAGEADRLGGRKAMILTGHSLATQTPLVKKVESQLGERHAGTFAGIRQHVPESGIAEAAALARQLGADLLVSLGGGSPIDAAKAVARTLAADTGTYLPHIALPTTLSAAEFSGTAGFTDEARQAKTGFSDPWTTPRVVIMDPELTLATPMWLWLASGIRSLDHAVETLYSPGDHPVNDLLALEAIRKLFAYLPRCKADPSSLEAREQCQRGAWMSFFGPGSVHMGLSHNLGRRIGASFNVPHGVTSCITLPHVMRYKAATEARRLAPIAHALQLVPADTPDYEAALVAADAVAGLVGALGLPARLSEVNVPADALDDIARSVVGDTPEAVAVAELLRRAY
ncbi:MAG: NAD-dependent methanol dehydrogenase [Chloroflexi bacterium]|nr:NAD-dependent methanol dehydrogenase [Chloroflexota bacterium]